MIAQLSRRPGKTRSGVIFALCSLGNPTPPPPPVRPQKLTISYDLSLPIFLYTISKLCYLYGSFKNKITSNDTCIISLRFIQRYNFQEQEVYNAQKISYPL